MRKGAIKSKNERKCECYSREVRINEHMLGECGEDGNSKRMRNTLLDEEEVGLSEIRRLKSRRK